MHGDVPEGYPGWSVHRVSVQVKVHPSVMACCDTIRVHEPISRHPSVYPTTLLELSFSSISLWPLPSHCSAGRWVWK